MTVGMDAILANQTSANTATAANSKSDTVDVADFYNLLIKQLQYQDPMNPVENTEFTAQLAQFSQLQAITDMKTSMDTLTQLQASTNNLTALTLIGKQVVARGNSVTYSGTGENLDFTLGDAASKVTVKIYNSNGSLVRTDELSSVAAGDAQYAWDGRDGEGNTVSRGKYYFTVSATDVQGSEVPVTTYAKGEVTGVKYENGNTYLTIGNKDVSLADIQKIEQ